MLQPGVFFWYLRAYSSSGAGFPGQYRVLDELVRLIGYGFTLGLVYGLVALAVSLPLLFWYAYKHRS